MARRRAAPALVLAVALVVGAAAAAFAQSDGDLLVADISGFTETQVDGVTGELTPEIFTQGAPVSDTRTWPVSRSDGWASPWPVRPRS